jgi:hypothetical protein
MRIDCLHVLPDGKTAQLSGVITRTSYPDVEVPVGKVHRFTVQDNGEPGAGVDKFSGVPPNPQARDCDDPTSASLNLPGWRRPGRSTAGTSKSAKRYPPGTASAARSSQTGVARKLHRHPSQDPERAWTFYRDVLGSVLTSTRSSRAGRGTRASGSGSPRGSACRSSRRRAILCRSASTTCPPRAALEAKCVEFHGGILDTGVCHMAFFSDPDDNDLMLHHRYRPYED